MVINNISLNIKSIRKKWGLTQEEFGAILGGTRGMIMQYEKNNAKMNEKMLDHLSRLADIKKETLIIKKLTDDEIKPLSITMQQIIEMYRNGAIDDLAEHVNREYIYNIQDGELEKEINKDDDHFRSFNQVDRLFKIDIVPPEIDTTSQEFKNLDPNIQRLLVDISELEKRLYYSEQIRSQQSSLISLKEQLINHLKEEAENLKEEIKMLRNYISNKSSTP